MCRLWGIRDDLAARGLPNLLIVEPFLFGFKSWGLRIIKNNATKTVTLLFILARPEGFPRTAHMCRLWGIRDDLVARGLPNLLIVEPFLFGFKSWGLHIIKTTSRNRDVVIYSGAPRRIRTLNLLIRSQMLYPIEPWAQRSYIL